MMNLNLSIIYGSLDDEAAIEDPRERSSRGHLLLSRLFVMPFAVATLVAIAIIPFSSSLRHAGSISSSGATCPNARVKLVGVTELNGAAVYNGVLVRALVSSPVTCTMGGYPVVGAQLTSHSTAMATDARATYLGGGIVSATKIPQILITPRPQAVSFTLQFVTGNGPTCPRVSTIQITLPGSRTTLRARPIFDAGGVALPMSFIDCGNLQVTPLLKGSRGRS